MNEITSVYGQSVDGEAMVTVESGANEPQDYEASAFLEFVEASVRALLHAFTLTHGALPELEAVRKVAEEGFANAHKVFAPLMCHSEDFKGFDGIDLVEAM
nr:hypothetical protein [Rhodococcus sp. (in: high G+C Gram-positive bacteria)]